ncbi:uncharacterized protein MELLADRAFT_70452 [Melampsora larici-populina 98AG31]|uniref:Uncharacterized protein n=1 Tax=Melampsora larici-populina (strain 98AG31 / pathotype 3-4-7) TaxID=747676 RepID=F4R3U4_MELLP|nr:uncharacterized protein MELLADRAFT_70452 [Melampsora larici-populina 98AG31]EGG13106.1 hypothetical protein MELLADRAFT_70452 [Melampsora larici-populina 98AG31]
MALPRFCPSKNSRSSLKDTTGSINLLENTPISLPRLCSSKNSQSSFKELTGSIDLSEKTSIYSSIGSVASRRHKPKHLKVTVPELENHQSIVSAGIEKIPLTAFRLQFERLKKSSQSSLSISNFLRNKSSKVEKRKTVDCNHSSSNLISSSTISRPKTSIDSQFPTIHHPNLLHELYSMPIQDDHQTTTKTSYLFGFTESRRGSISDGLGLMSKTKVELNKGISHQRTETESSSSIIKRKTFDRKSSTKHKFRAQSYSSFSFLEPPKPRGADDSLSLDVLEITLQASLNQFSSISSQDLQINSSSTSSTSQDPILDNQIEDYNDDDDDDRSSFCTVSDRHSLEYEEAFHFPKWPKES